MTEYRAGGRRAIDRVLAPEFAEDLRGLGVAELRSRRAEAIQVESDLSYARRMLQGRIDLLLADQGRRRDGVQDALAQARTDEEIVAELTAALTSGDDGAREPRALQAGGDSVARHLTTDPYVGATRRDVDAAITDPMSTDTAALDFVALGVLLERLQGLEQRVSADRQRVQGVADACAAELTRRYGSAPRPV